MSYLLQFNSVALPGTLSVVAQPIEYALAVSKAPRVDGGLVGAASIRPKRISIRGSLMCGPLGGTALRTQVDTLLAALCAGPGTLYAGESDRYYRDVVVESVGLSYEQQARDQVVHLDIGMVSGDPFRYGSTITTVTWSSPVSGATSTITPGGAAPTLPVYSLRVGTGHAAFSAVFECTTTGESCTINGNLSAADVVVIDARQRTVTKGGANAMGLFDGEFPRLLATASVLKVTYTAGTIDQIQTAHQPRYW